MRTVRAQSGLSRRRRPNDPTVESLADAEVLDDYSSLDLGIALAVEMFAHIRRGALWCLDVRGGIPGAELP